MTIHGHTITQNPCARRWLPVIPITVGLALVGPARSGEAIRLAGDEVPASDVAAEPTIDDGAVVRDVWAGHFDLLKLRIQQSRAAIADAFGIPPAAVQAAVDYIAEHKDEVPDFQRQIEERNVRGNPPEMEAKLAQARAKRLVCLTGRQDEHPQEACRVGNL